MRLIVVLLCLCAAIGSRAQSPQLPEAPQPMQGESSSAAEAAGGGAEIAWLDDAKLDDAAQVSAAAEGRAGHTASGQVAAGQAAPETPVDANGKPIPLERQQPKRILGLMPNFRTVSGGEKPHPPGWKYNFTVATHQATDYSTFVILGMTSLIAEAENTHPDFGKGVDGLWEYSWRGFLDKTDGTYLSAWLLPSLLHEDTRYYALGSGHRVATRVLYLISREAVGRTYGGRQTPNIAGLGGKVLAQVISRSYYPPSATDFDSLASKFGYAVMRDVMNSSIREFYPDIAAHFIRKHREKMARKAGSSH